MPSAEAFDVVVVRDPAMTVGAIMALSRDLAHLTGNEPSDVELALQGGRFVVYPALTSERVDAVVDQLRTMGAVVQVKPAEHVPVLESLSSESAPRGRRFDGPVAHFADADLGLDSGAFNTGPGVQPIPDYDAGIGKVLSSEDAQTAKFESVPTSPAATNGAARAAEAEMRALAAKLEAAPAIQTLDGVDGAAFEAAEEAAAKAAAPREPTNPDASLEPADVDEVPVRHVSPAIEPGLQLDLPRAPDPTPPPSSSAPSFVADTLPSAASMMSSPDMILPKRGLLFEDPWSNALALVAACGLLCLLLAFAVTRSTARAPIDVLEKEIAESYGGPDAVERGDARAPSEIQAELDDVYGDARFQFLMVLLLGVPAGLGLSRIRR